MMSVQGKPNGYPNEAVRHWIFKGSVISLDVSVMPKEWRVYVTFTEAAGSAWDVHLLPLL